jgi:protoheme IX farnesyltransferase
VPAAANAAKLAFNIFKLRIGIVIAITAAAGLIVTPGAKPALWQSALLVLAVLVSSAAAGAFNQYYEYDLDRSMARTARRPFASGTLSRHWGWLAVILVLTAGAVAVATFATNWIAALYTFLGAFVYAVVYTVWLKRRTWLNIVIGGLAGSFAVLAGAAAVVPSLSAEALVLAVVLFLWTPPHFWSLSIAFRDDYARAGVPMLPVVKGDAAAARAILVNAALLVAASLALGMFAPGWIYLGFALLGGGYFLRECVRLVVQPGRRQAMRAFHASLMQLSLVLIGVMLDAAFR